MPTDARAADHLHDAGFIWTLLLVRHAHVDNTQRPGPLGPPLSSLGRRQAECVAGRLASERLSRIYTSPLRRARETADAIRAHHADTPLAVDEDLREISRFHFVPDSAGRELVTDAEMAQERDAVERFANRLWHSQAAGDTVAVVGHGNCFCTLIPILAGREPSESILMDINHSSVTILHVGLQGGAILRLANCVHHLAAGEVT